MKDPQNPSKNNSLWNGSGRQIRDSFLTAASQVILNKKAELELALICFLARGHLLVEDIPGVGKTTFVKVLRQLLGLRFNRIQFTSDLLPGDVLGTPVFHQDTSKFELHPGPIFADFVMADELNRATPRTQSALLQAMEERCVSIDQQTYELSPLFFLVATQNPRFHLGTYPLPESQLDRFLMRMELGYPGKESEISLLQNSGLRKKPEDLTAILTESQWLSLRETAKTIHVSREIAEMIFKLLEFSRKPNLECTSLSTRAGIALADAAKAAALLEGREFVIPEDLKKIAPSVINHRLLLEQDGFKNSSLLVGQWMAEIEVS